MNLGRLIRRRGFTLVELMAVIATIAILAGLLLPVLNKAKIKAQRISCTSNLHQLGYAWKMYSEENNSYLVESYPTNNSNAWVFGDMTIATQATNAALIEQGKLYPFCQSTPTYHCPADKGVLIGGQITASKRSYSMNCFMGARDPSLDNIPSTAIGYVPFFSKDSDVPQPSQMWVMLDEDERSIDDGFFKCDPTGNVWFDFPAISAHRHNYSFPLTFADGHTDVWRVTDSRSMALARKCSEQSGNYDLSRLASATTVPR